MGYTRDQLSLCAGATIPDLIGRSCRLLFVGINPGLQTAMTGIHFAHPSNRFWPALRRAGLIDWVPDVSPTAPSVAIEGHDPTGTETVPRQASPRYPALRGRRLRPSGDVDDTGMTGGQREDLIAKGIGITNLVRRATVRASELSEEELRAGGERLTAVVEEVGPRVVAVAGATAYRDAFGDKRAALGLQPVALGPARLWVVPNPSGLNAHETIDSLASWYRRVADEAGVS